MKNILFLVSGKSNSGKGEFSRYLETLFKNTDDHVIRCSLSTYIRNITKDDFYWDGIDTPHSREFMAEVYRLGTEIYPYHMARRVWERDVCPYLKENQNNYIIVESFREKNNYDYFKLIQDEGDISDIITVRITRPDYNVVGEKLISHVSETDLDSFNFDYEVINDRDIESFKEQVNEFYNKLKGDKNGDE